MSCKRHQIYVCILTRLAQFCAGTASASFVLFYSITLFIRWTKKRDSAKYKTKILSKSSFSYKHQKKPFQFFLRKDQRHSQSIKRNYTRQWKFIVDSEIDSWALLTQFCLFWRSRRSNGWCINILTGAIDNREVNKIQGNK